MPNNKVNKTEREVCMRAVLRHDIVFEDFNHKPVTLQKNTLIYVDTNNQIAIFDEYKFDVDRSEYCIIM